MQCPFAIDIKKVRHSGYLSRIIHLVSAQDVSKNQHFYPLINTRRWAYQGVKNISFFEIQHTYLII